MRARAESTDDPANAAHIINRKPEAKRCETVVTSRPRPLRLNCNVRSWSRRVIAGLSGGQSGTLRKAERHCGATA